MSGLDWTRCPHCTLPLSAVGRTLRCGSGHAFDIARQGYVNLSGNGQPANADTPAMLEARARFLAAGHYNRIADSVARLTRGLRIVEVGAGTAFYLSRILDLRDKAEGLATDVSVAAARRAARAHPRIAAVVADTWLGLPLQSGSVDAVVCVFAPRNTAEFARVLRPGGSLVVVQPLPEHLAELRSTYGLLGVPADKSQKLAASLAGWELSEPQVLRYESDLTAGDVADLVSMGPNAFHSLPEQYAPSRVRVAVEIVVAVSGKAP